MNDLLSSLQALKTVLTRDETEEPGLVSVEKASMDLRESIYRLREHLKIPESASGILFFFELSSTLRPALTKFLDFQKRQNMEAFIACATSLNMSVEELKRLLVVGSESGEGPLVDLIGVDEDDQMKGEPESFVTFCVLVCISSEGIVGVDVESNISEYPLITKQKNINCFQES